jgi:hypothetical protein
MCRDALETIHTRDVRAEKPSGNAHLEDEPVESEVGVASHADGFRGFEREVDQLRLAEGEASWTSAEPSGFLGRGQSSRRKGGSRGALAGAHEMHPTSAERARTFEGGAAESKEMEGDTGPKGSRGSVLVGESVQLRSRRSSVGGSTTREFLQGDTWQVADAAQSPAVSAVSSRPGSRVSGAGPAGKDNKMVAAKISSHRLSGNRLSENRLSGDVGSGSQASQRIWTGGQVSEERPARMSVLRIALDERDALKAGRRTSAELVSNGTERAGGPASAADVSIAIADVPRKRAASMAVGLRARSPLGLRSGSSLQAMQRGHSLSAGAGEIRRNGSGSGMENGAAGGFEGLGSALADFLQKGNGKKTAESSAGGIEIGMDKGWHGTADAGGNENLGSAVAEFLMKQNGMGAGGEEMEQPRNPGTRAERDGGLETLGSAFAGDEGRRVEAKQERRSGDRTGSNESLSSGVLESLRSRSEGGGAKRERMAAAKQGSIESLGFAVAEFLTNQSGGGEAEQKSAVRNGSIESLGSAIAEFLTKRSEGGEEKRERRSAVRNGSIESLGSAIAEFLSGQNEEAAGEGEQRLKARVKHESFKGHRSLGTGGVEFLRSKCAEGTETEQNGTILVEQNGSSKSSRQPRALAGDRSPDERSLEGRSSSDRPSVDLAKRSCSRLSSVSFRGEGDGRCQVGGLSDGRKSSRRFNAVVNDLVQETKSGRLPVSPLIVFSGQVVGQPVRILCW